MSVSGRAGLFTMDDGRFFGDLRGMPYTASKRQKSGALRLEFGNLTLTDATITSATVTTTIFDGIMAVTNPTRAPITRLNASAAGNSGFFSVIAVTPYSSGRLSIQVTANGQFSGTNSGMNINYMVVGF